MHLFCSLPSKATPLSNHIHQSPFNQYCVNLAQLCEEQREGNGRVEFSGAEARAGEERGNGNGGTAGTRHVGT